MEITETLINKMHTEIDKSIIEVIKKNVAHYIIYNDEPFIHPYKANTISYDHSGYVEITTVDKLNELIEEESCKNVYDLLDNIYINSWEPSYISNYGKNWITYHRLVYDEFEEYIFKNFDELMNEDEELDDELYYALHDILNDYLFNNSYAKYLTEIISDINLNCNLS